MKNLVWILAICLVMLPSLAISQSGATVIQPTGYTSVLSLNQSDLQPRVNWVNDAKGKHGPISAIPNIVYNVNSLEELKTVNSFERAILFYYDASTNVVHVAFKLYGNKEDLEKAEQTPAYKLYLIGYNGRAVEMKLDGDRAYGSMQWVDGNFCLSHAFSRDKFSNPEDALWTYPLFTCAGYGWHFVGGDNCWGYQLTFTNHLVTSWSTDNLN